MNTKEVRRALLDNNISQSACLINPPICREGALCLCREPDGRWTVTLNERGEYLIQESFASEDAACRYFLKKVLIDPTYRIGFKQSDLSTFEDDTKELLRKYRLDRKE
jgi:hypothetical protein